MSGHGPRRMGPRRRAKVLISAAALAPVLALALATLPAIVALLPRAAQAAPASTATTPRPVAQDIAHFAVDGGGEKLRVPLPANWVPVAQLRAGDVRQTDYAPDNDVPRGNDERLRIEAVADASTEPGEFVTLLARDRKQQCPELIATAISSARENGYPTAVSLFDCPRAPGKGPPLLMLKVIRGEQWLYIVARSSTRADTRPDKQANERTRIADWAQFMRRLSLCHQLRPDHACPRTRLP